MEIWLALLGAPVLALADQVIAYAAVGWACRSGHDLAVPAIHAALLVATALTAWPAWRLWRATREPLEEKARGRHFLAGMGLACAALSVLVIAAMGFTAGFIDPCVR